MKKILLLISVIITTVVFGQYTTPTIDGSIGGSEYGSNNSYTSGTRTWNITWDATNLYVGVSGHTNFGDAIVLYIDIDPQVPVNGGDNSNGAKSGTGYDGVTPTFPFRADFFAYVKDGYDDYKSDDGANGWGGSTTASLTKSFNDGNDVGEFAIPWAAITGSGIPTSFNFVALMTYTSGSFSMVPSTIPNGTTPEYIRYFTVSNTGDGTSTAPFSQESYCLISVDAPGFGAIEVFDFTMNVSSKTITRAAGAGGVWEIANDLIINDGTIDFGSSTDEVIVNGDVNIGANGSLELSTAVGGDIYFGGDWTCSGAFTPNDRAIFINGTGDQTINNSSSNFDYVIIDKSSGDLDFFGSSSSVTIDQDLTISSGTLEIPVNKSLTVSNDLNNSVESQLLVKSSSSGQGSLIFPKTVGTSDVEATVERYISQYTGDEDGWHLLSSPIESGIIDAEFAPIINVEDLYYWDEDQGDDGMWINYHDGLGGNGFTSFVNGRGYICSYNSSGVRSFASNLIAADITFSNQSYSAGSENAGWHLFGNPYTAALDVSNYNADFSISNFSVPQLYIESAGDYFPASDYGNIIPSTQGFFVQTTSSTNSITIPADARVHDHTQNWHKSDINYSNAIQLKSTSAQNDFYNLTTIGFDSEATNVYDIKFDAHKLTGSSTVPRMYTVDEAGDKYALNYLKGDQSSRIVALNFHPGTTGEQTIEVAYNSLEFTDQVYLEDTFENQMIDLNTIPTYTFNAEIGDNENRFQLHFGATGIEEVQKENLQAYVSGSQLYILGEEGVADLKIYNLQAQELYSETIELTSDFSQSLNFKTGVYIISLQTKEEIKTAKVMIK
jgi:hypothetical protein